METKGDATPLRPPDVGRLPKCERCSVMEQWFVDNDIAFEEGVVGLKAAWVRAQHRHRAAAWREREREAHRASNVRYKHALPTSVARMARKRGAEEVAARKLSMLMGEAYHLPRKKRGRKVGYKVQHARAHDGQATASAALVAGPSAPIEVSPLAVRVVTSDECPELVAATTAATVVGE